MPRVSRVKALPDYELDVHFDDGARGTISLRERLFGVVFEPLLDVALFNQVTIDQFGAVCWPNGADLAPDALYEQLRKTVAAR